MNVKEFHTFMKKGISTLYKVENGKVVEYKIETEKKKNGKPFIWQLEEDNTFGVSFNKPKTGWKPDYALPVVFVEGYDEKTQKLKLETPKRRGGWDTPGAYFWIDGDFYLTEEAAKSNAQ